MASIVYHHSDIKKANEVFSFQGYKEETHSELELAIKSFELSSEQKQQQNLTMGEVLCKIKFIPNQKEKSVKTENISLYGNSSVKTVILAFGLTSPFFLITGKGKISKEFGQSLLAHLSFALSTLRINFPFFVQIGEKANCSFIGRYVARHFQILYNSGLYAKEIDVSNYSNVRGIIANELNGRQLEDSRASAKVLLSTGPPEKRITAIFDFPEESAEGAKTIAIKDSPTAVALLSIKQPEKSDSILRKAVQYASNQYTSWPTSPTKSNLARQLQSKCKEIDCERPLKGALPGGILEQLALSMCNESFTMLWRSFISLIRESVAKKQPFAPVKLHYNDSLLQQKINVLNSALESMRSGRMSFSCPVCDDDMFNIDSEIRKLEAVTPAVSVQRFQEIKSALLTFRSQNEYPSFDKFNASFPHNMHENSAIHGVWDIIPFYVADAKEAIEHVLEWFDTAKPAVIHAEMIIILVAIEVRQLSGDNSHGAYAQRTLSKAISKALILPELSMLLQPLDFLKAADDIASTIIEGKIGIEMLRTVTEMFPTAPNFVDALLRNGFAVAKSDEERKNLCSIFKERGFFSSSNITDRSVRVTITGALDNNSYRVYCASTPGKKTIVATAKAQPR